MKRILYSFESVVDPAKLSIRIDKDFYSYRGHTKEDWKNLLMIAKAAENIDLKVALNEQLTPTEKLAKELYRGVERPNLQVTQDGTIEVSDGRHRMQAVKEENIFLRMEMYADAHISKIEVIDKHNSFTENFSYLLLENRQNIGQEMKRKGYSITEVSDLIEGKSYIVFSKKDVLQDKSLQSSILKLNEKSFPIYSTKEKIGEDILKDER